jgi:hypothetical protein
MGREHRAPPTDADKWRYSLYSALLVFLLFRPETFMIVQKALGWKGDYMVANSAGCPTSTGFALHLVIFTVLIKMMMG